MRMNCIFAASVSRLCCTARPIHSVPAESFSAAKRRSSTLGLVVGSTARVIGVVRQKRMNHKGARARRTDAKGVHLRAAFRVVLLRHIEPLRWFFMAAIILAGSNRKVIIHFARRIQHLADG